VCSSDASELSQMVEVSKSRSPKSLKRSSPAASKQDNEKSSKTPETIKGLESKNKNKKKKKKAKTTNGSSKEHQEPPPLDKRNMGAVPGN
jgi:hypothetical protein